MRDLTNDLNCLPLQYVLLPFVSLVSREIQKRLCKSGCIVELNEPRSEKNGLRGLRPGPIQTGLRSHRRWLEP